MGPEPGALGSGPKLNLLHRMGEIFEVGRVRRCKKYLRLVAQIFQIILPGLIEFRKHIIEQQDRRRSPEVFENVFLCGQHREHH